MHAHRGRVDHRHLVEAHRGCARGVQRGLGVGAHPVEDLLVGLDRGAGGELAVVVRRERRLVEDVAGHADRLDPLAPVGRRGQVVEHHRRVLLGVARDDPDAAAGVGVHGADVHLVAVALGGHAAVVADRDRQEVEHQVGVVDVVVAAGEATALEVVGGAEPAAVEEPLVADAGTLVPPQARRDGDRLLGGVLDVDLEVVLEVLTDAGQVVDQVDAEAGKVVLVADAGELEQLRGVDGAAAQDHLARGDAAGPAGAEIVDADGALALEPDAGAERERVDGQVLAVPHGVQVGPRGREAAAAVHVAVEAGETLLAVAVDVVGEVVARLLHGLEERAEERVGRPGPARARAGRRRRATRRRRRCRRRGGGSPSA